MVRQLHVVLMLDTAVSFTSATEAIVIIIIIIKIIIIIQIYYVLLISSFYEFESVNNYSVNHCQNSGRRELSCGET